MFRKIATKEKENVTADMTRDERRQERDITPASAPEPPTEESRIQRARTLVRAGELSSAVQALEAGAVAPGTAKTHEQLQEKHPDTEPYMTSSASVPA